MGVTAALAGMLLVALPGGAAYAVDDAPAGDVPAVQVDESAPVEEIALAEEVAPVEGDAEPAASTADEVPAVPAEPAADAAAELATVPPTEVAPEAQTAEAPAAAVAQGNRTLSGNVKFPSEMNAAARAKFNVWLRAGESSTPKEYTTGSAGFSLNTTTGDWSISGLDPVIYSTAVFSLPNVQFNLKVMFKLDLRAGSMLGVFVDAAVGEVTGVIIQDRTDVGITGVFLRNTATNAVIDATNDARAGGQGPDESRKMRSTPVTQGNYIMYVKLLNGRTIYYTGSATGSLKSSDARTIAVTLHNTTRLANMDVREFIKIFADVPAVQKFYTDISWMEAEGITTGVKQANGSVKYLPKASVSREAMIAFLYRLEAPKNYKAPKTSPFTDVKPGHKFYK